SSTTWLSSAASWPTTCLPRTAPRGPLSPFAVRARTGEVSDRRGSDIGENTAVPSRALVAPAEPPVTVEPPLRAPCPVTSPEPPPGAVAGDDGRAVAVSADLDGCA